MNALAHVLFVAIFEGQTGFGISKIMGSPTYMKVKQYLLVTGFLLFGCESNPPDLNSTDPKIHSDTMSPKVTMQDVEVKDDAFPNGTIENCNCKDVYAFKNNGHFNTDLSFYRSHLSDHKSDSIFKVYSSDSLRRSITSIRFLGIDTIPEKFRVFVNVEHIVIESRKSITGLDVFPNLKSVFFWGSQIDINPSDKWLKEIEGLYAEKSVIKGLQTFTTTPNLKVMYFGHARLEPFPSDFEKLKCLRRITLGAYQGEIDLSKIDLAFNPCIESVEFSTWYDAFSGIPKGLDTNRTFRIVINHQRLTKEEKEIIQTYNDRTN